MDDQKTQAWLESIIPSHHRLTPSVEGIIKNLLNKENIDYLTITSRVKTPKSTLEKIKRKNYSDAKQQLTDLSGIRIIVFFESDIPKVTQLIREAFKVDENNSSNKDSTLKSNQTGYRSVHYVCELGENRSSLPENQGLSELKFELQIRTVLQHAWAELAHDRNYKFTGKLPAEAERKLFLYAGMLELADRGLDELSNELDSYVKSVETEVSSGELDLIIDSINLVTFMEEWAQQHNFPLKSIISKLHFTDLIEELNSFDIRTLDDLKKIIPASYVEISKKEKYGSTIYGVVRDWMLIHDWRRFERNVKYNWVISDLDLLYKFIPDKEIEDFKKTFPLQLDPDFERDFGELIPEE